jgi:hypothetical protein
MTTGGSVPGTVCPVDGNPFDRLRRVDQRVWDGLLAVAVVGLGVLGFALRQPSANEPPAWFGYTG